MISLWIVFAVFAFDYLAKIVSLWAVLNAWALGLSIYLLIKNKFPSKKYIIISIIFAVVDALSYLGYSLDNGYELSFVPQMLTSGIPTLFASLAVFSVMEKYGDFALLNTNKKNSPLISILIGIGAGAVLGTINYFLGKNGLHVDFKITFSRILMCFDPAIKEEITNRAIFMAFCVYIFAKQKKAASKGQIFTMWFMMTVPHCLSHGYALLPSLVLLVLFGLPFAFLQRKRDITSSMISHGLVDAIRFAIFGLPV